MLQDICNKTFFFTVQEQDKSGANKDLVNRMHCASFSSLTNFSMHHEVSELAEVL